MSSDVDKKCSRLLSISSLVAGGFLGLHLGGVCLSFQMRSVSEICRLKRRSSESIVKVQCDYREVLWYVVLHERDVSGVTGASSLLVSLVLVTGVGGGGGFLGLGLGGVCLSFQMRSVSEICRLKRRSSESIVKVQCDYREVLWYVVLHERDVSGVTGASSLLVSLVLVTGVGVGKARSSRETAGRREGGCEGNDGQEDDGDFGEHLFYCCIM